LRGWIGLVVREIFRQPIIGVQSVTLPSEAELAQIVQTTNALRLLLRLAQRRQELPARMAMIAMMTRSSIRVKAAGHDAASFSVA